MSQISRYSYTSVPTIREFASSEAFLRGLMGPFGSGKSSGCVMEIVRRARIQRPGPDGIRRSRYAVIRNTYPQLRDTTIKTVHDWFPPRVWGRYLKVEHDYYVTGIEGVELEILFRALDRPDHVQNLLSLELTGAWVNEAREVPKEIIDGLTGRVGRYPSMRDGGPSWSGIIMDTNPPDDDSWWYRMFEEDRPENAAIFKQASGLSPQAENLIHLPPDYYRNLMVGKDDDWIQVYVRGEYGSTRTGKPVYQEYVDSMHCAGADLTPIRGLPLHLGWDFGLTPACVVVQQHPSGYLMVLDEFAVQEHGAMGLRQFARAVVKPGLAERYAGFELIGWGDPAGNARAQTDEQTCFQILAEEGLHASPAATNNATARRDAVKRFLIMRLDDRPGLLLSPRCAVLRKGFRGKYQYERVQVSGEERYQERPCKNHYSHAHDGLQYAMLPFTYSDSLVDPLDLESCWRKQGGQQ